MYSEPSDDGGASSSIGLDQSGYATAPLELLLELGAEELALLLEGALVGAAGDAMAPDELLELSELGLETAAELGAAALGELAGGGAVPWLVEFFDELGVLPECLVDLLACVVLPELCRLVRLRTLELEPGSAVTSTRFAIRSAEAVSLANRFVLFLRSC